MENPLSAREFLKRFHLPQLVRISSLDNSSQDETNQDLSFDSSTDFSKQRAQQQAAPISPAGHSNTSISSSFVALSSCPPIKPSHEPSDWTYSQASQQTAVKNRNTSEDLYGEKIDQLSEDDENDPNLKFRSISAWSSVQVDRMLELQRRAQKLHYGPVRVPRASLVQVPACKSAYCCDNDQSGRAKSGKEEQQRKSVDFRDEARARQQQVLDLPMESHNTEKRVGKSFEENIRLTPPSKRPTLSKLHLNQPFLLYKAYRKLELCAYLIDPKNEINDKSGDPIYFPQNYPGWFSLRGPNNTGRCKPFETIDEVCRTNAQIFLSRDELVAYELPSKLSHLTKLKNNQLLALPLAINLDRKSIEINSGKQHEQQSVSDIKQMVIKCGQVLKICGIYEDVLPLIKGKQQQQKKQTSDAKSNRDRTAVKKHQSSDKQTTYNYEQAHNSISQHKVAQQPVNARGLCQKQQIYQSPDKKRTSLYSNYDQIKYAPGCQHYQRYIDANQTQAPTKPKNHGVQQKHPVGQRYARCILLSNNSVDQLTNLSSDKSCNLMNENNEAAESQQETEVLIPIDQRGRFYLCATNQSIRNEFQFYLSSVVQSTNLVMKLSQIIHLLGLTRRLKMGSAPPQLAEEWHQKEHRSKSLASPHELQLPLTVHLVFGPRPATYSPTMLGTSSTMESYFRSEANIAGHLITCNFNPNFVVGNTMKAHLVNESVCNCYLKLSDPTSGSMGRFGMFSAILRIEKMTKRDVLLACTIKKNPLLHIDLFNEDHGLYSGGGKKSTKIHESSRGTQHLSGDWQQARLNALREVSFEHKSDQFKTTAASKSSFSRLRACRSLISLNGRRKKQRPNIPSCMFTAPSGSQQTDDLSSSSFDGPSPGGGGIGFSSLALEMSVGAQSNQLNQFSGDHLIVMVEFDCNDEELRFVRTFVESSIPTSSIPDLVLSRMEFCQRNSLNWERQLKLSYKSLSADFDSCQLQMEQNRRQLKLYANLPCVQHNQRQLPVPCGQPPSSQHPCVASHRSYALTTSAATTQSGHSTASSRSSSGVSSAGAERQQQASGATFANLPPSILHSSNIAEPAGATSSSASAISLPTGKEELVQQPTNRLLRLVHRILPKSSAPHRRAEHQQRSIAQVSNNNRCELLPGGRNASSSSSSSSIATTMRTGNNNSDVATLMNAQKVHRRMTTSHGRDLRHLAVRDIGQQEESRESRPLEEKSHRVNGRGSKDKDLAQSGNESATSSHLYESLERLNEARLMKEAAAKRRSAADSKASWFQQQVQQRQQQRGQLNKRLPAIGRSIEYLIGGRLRVVGRGWQAATASTAAVQVKNGDNKDNTGSISATESEKDEAEDEDDYDDWWQSGDGDTRESTGERFCVSLGADKHRQASAGKRGDQRQIVAQSWQQIDQQKRNRALADLNMNMVSNQQQLCRGRRSRSTGKRSDGLRGMEPVSIEHDEFISMVCHDEPPKRQASCSSGGSDSSSSTLDGGSLDNSSQDNKAHCVVGRSTSIESKHERGMIEPSDKEIIYANLAIDGKHLLQANGRPVGRMERKLMKMRGKREPSPLSRSRRLSRPLSHCHELAWHSDHHLARQDASNQFSYLGDDDWRSHSKHHLSSAWSSSLGSSSAESSQDFRNRLNDKMRQKNAETRALSIGSSSSVGVQSASNTTTASSTSIGADWPQEKQASSGASQRRRRRTLAVVGQVTNTAPSSLAPHTNVSSPDVRWTGAAGSKTKLSDNLGWSARCERTMAS